jgi:hypothetical protein
MAHYLTLAADNQFTFTCPVFNANTKMAACTMLREAVWMGKHVEKRQGCQAAMNCSMCPAAQIVKNISYGKGEVSDDYGSKEPKQGKLHADVLERIVNTVPIAREVERFSLTPNERDLLYSAKERIQAQLKTAPGKSQFIAPKKVSTTLRDETDDTTPRQRTVVAKKNDTLNQAAKTGDMAAALNIAA